MTDEELNFSLLLKKKKLQVQEYNFSLLLKKKKEQVQEYLTEEKNELEKENK